MSLKSKLCIIFITLLICITVSCELIPGFASSGLITLTSHTDGDVLFGIVTLEGGFTGDVTTVIIYDGTDEHTADLVISASVWSIEFDTSAYAEGPIDLLISGMDGFDVLDTIDVEFEVVSSVSSQLQFEFVNFAVENPNYLEGSFELFGDWPGTDRDWLAIGERDIQFDLVAGAGTVPSSVLTTIEENPFIFSIIETDSNNFSWFPANAGNHVFLDNYIDFSVEVPLDGGVHIVKIDAATHWVEISVDGTVQTTGVDYDYSSIINIVSTFEGDPTGETGELVVRAASNVLITGGYHGLVSDPYNGSTEQTITVDFAESISGFDVADSYYYLDADGDFEWNQYLEWGNNSTSPTVDEPGVILQEPLGYESFYLAETDVTIAHVDLVSGIPSEGLIKGYISINNLPGAAEGKELTLIGRDLYDSAGNNIIWDNDNAALTSTVSSGSWALSFYFDPNGYDFSGWDSNYYEVGDDLVINVVNSGTWIRAIRCYDDRYENRTQPNPENWVENTLFKFDGDIGGTIGVSDAFGDGDEISITLDYNDAEAYVE